jgi:hypothetical protein
MLPGTSRGPAHSQSRALVVGGRPDTGSCNWPNAWGYPTPAAHVTKPLVPQRNLRIRRACFGQVQRRGVRRSSSGVRRLARQRWRGGWPPLGRWHSVRLVIEPGRRGRGSGVARPIRRAARPGRRPRVHQARLLRERNPQMSGRPADSTTPTIRAIAAWVAECLPWRAGRLARGTSAGWSSLSASCPRSGLR